MFDPIIINNNFQNLGSYDRVIMYRVYTMLLNLNEITFTEVWIDPHYELKHRDSIDDELILELVKIVNFDTAFYSGSNELGFKFYESDICYNEKLYRLITTIPPYESYLGVRNAYRRSK